MAPESAPTTKDTIRGQIHLELHESKCDFRVSLPKKKGHASHKEKFAKEQKRH